MCGLIAIFGRREGVAQADLKSALTSIAHRGPDGWGTWISDSREVALGHVRLSIIDLADGAQPMSNEAGTVHAIVNGEFYGFEELREDLIKRGHSFRSRSDSEILVHLYEEFGTSCLSMLRGEFSFVLWDGEQRTLFAARDRFGIKPLYYGWKDGALVLASEIKAILAVGVEARWDTESFYQDLQFHIDEDRTLFHGIKQVPPGHFVLASGSHHRIGKYWDLLQSSQVTQEVAGLSEAALIERFGEKLEAATRIRMRADVPVGCYLSGGIDSSTLIALASRFSNDPIDAFTIDFAGDASGETEHATEMARHVGARFHCVTVDEQLLAQHFSDAVWHCELIHYNCNFVAKFLLSRAVRDRGIKVVLTGAGADEILLGYPNFVRDSAAPVQSLAISGASAKEYARGESSTASKIRSILGFVPAWMSDVGGRGRRISRLLDEDFAAGFTGRDTAVAFLDRFAVGPEFSWHEPALKSSYLFCRSILCSKLLAYLGDRVEMAHSIEARLPFLDHELAAFAVRLPTDMKIRNGIEKYVLREAAAPLVTRRIYERRKNPFLAPHGVRGSMLEFIGDKLNSRSFSGMGFFDRAAVQGTLDRVFTGDAAENRDADVRDLLLITSACVMQERFGLV